METKDLRYQVSFTIGQRTVTISDVVGTNHEKGEANQIADMFYRAMLAYGVAPLTACEALGKIAMRSGFVPEDTSQVQLEFGVGSDGVQAFG